MFSLISLFRSMVNIFSKFLQYFHQSVSGLEIMQRSPSKQLCSVISTSVYLATKAGAEVVKIAKTGQLGVVDKGVQDFQTEADRKAQRLIVGNLMKKFPALTIVGEEDLEKDSEDDFELDSSCDEDIMKLTFPSQYDDIDLRDITVWVDPLDGTTEFVKGFLEHVTVLIGISVNGRPIAGVMNQPFYGTGGRTMWGLVGFGCFGLETKLLPKDRLIITTTASHGNKNIDDSIESLKPDETLRVGGAGHKVLLVIEGKAHSYLFPSAGSKRWDTCAPEAILESLGGQMTDVLGKKIEYKYRPDGNYQNYLGLVASRDAELHKRVISSIPEAVRCRLCDASDAELKAKI